PAERSMCSRLDGSAGDRECGRGLILGELEEVAAGKHVALVVAQPFEGGQKTLSSLGSKCGFLGVLAGWPGLRSGAQRQRGASAPGATAISRLVRDDRQQPGTKSFTATEAPERTVRLDECVLCSLLGVRGVAGDHERRAEGERLIGEHELFEG